MTWLWIGLAAAVALGGLRYRRRLSSGRLDDAAVRRIIEQGRLGEPDDQPLDLDEAARAEEEFWEESWDEPEEYRP